MRHVVSCALHATSYFVSERQRKTIDVGNAGAIMRIRVTDSRSTDPNQDVLRSDLGNWNVRLLERFSDLHESHRSHFANVAIALPSYFENSAIYFFSVTRVTVKISLGRT